MKAEIKKNGLNDSNIDESADSDEDRDQSQVRNNIHNLVIHVHVVKCANLYLHIHTHL